MRRTKKGSDALIRPISSQGERANVTPLAACTARVAIEGHLYTVEFIVLPSCSRDSVLGWDFVANHNAVIACYRAELELSALRDVETVRTRPSFDKLFVSDDAAVPPCSSLLVPVP